MSSELLEARYVIITTDKRMESVWTEDMIAHRAQVILLTDDEGGPIYCGLNRWASGLGARVVEPSTGALDYQAPSVRKR